MEPRDPFDAHDAHDAYDPPSEGDALDHLWNAAHEMLRAMRTVLDAADEFVASQRAARPVADGPRDAREGRVHHIDIDVRARPDERGRSDIDIDADADADADADTGVM